MYKPKHSQMVSPKSSSKINVGIEILRLVAAFLVVCIHTSSPEFMSPIQRLAVPIFYFLTGYFSYGDNLYERMTKTMGNYSKWWIRSFVVLSIISILILMYWGEFNLTFSGIKQIFTSGQTDMLTIHYNGKDYSLVVPLWFLYHGALTLFLLRLFSNQIFKPFVFIGISLISLVSIVNNQYNLSIPIIERLHNWTAITLPFIYLGLICKKYNIITMLKRQKYLMLEFSLLFVLYYFTFNKNATVSLISPIMVLFVVAVFGKIKIKNWDVNHQISLYIYIYHSLVFFILSVMGIHLYAFSAIFVFIISLLLSFSYLNVESKLISWGGR